MIGAHWRGFALDPPRAFGSPPARGRLRVEPEDFAVDEELGFTASGDGPHVLLRVRKRGANTDWVARELARAAGCRPADVGYAGLKDRHAVTTQWFTVPGARRGAEEWPGAKGGTPADGYEVLEASAHRRKLPRGALKRNHFRLRVRDCVADRESVAARVALLSALGVPNYFGPQRFGRDGANLERARRWADDPAARTSEAHTQRGFRLSAARSLVFNAVLAARVLEGSWGRLEPGDIANLDERGTVFAVDAADTTLAQRCAALEIHPTGPLWGSGPLASGARIGALERETCQSFAALLGMLEDADLRQERRSLRLVTRGLEHEWDADDLVLRFSLAPGAYATTVLRELLDAPDDAG